MMKIYSPEGTIALPSLGLAPAPLDLKGVRIGILNNTKPNAEVFMRRAVEILEKKYGLKFAQIAEKNAALAAPDDLIEGLSREVQIVLTGSAD